MKQLPQPTARMDSLIGRRYSILKFADLPVHCQISTLWFNVIEGSGWSDVAIPVWRDDKEAKAGLIALLPEYIDHYGEVYFGLVTLSVDELKASIIQDEDFSSTWKNWEEFHASYGTGPSDHPADNRWPVLLSYDNYETIWDGWHRFNSYIRDGATEVEAMFYPQMHHLAAHGLLPAAQ